MPFEAKKSLFEVLDMLFSVRKLVGGWRLAVALRRVVTG
jgi:hypothetical protein